MISLVCLALLFLNAIAAPLAGPTFLPASYHPSLLSVQRSFPCSCNIGQFLIVAGGLETGGVASARVDVIDMASGTRVATNNLTVARQGFACQVFSTDGCLVVGGIDAAGTDTASVELITINPTTGLISSITSQASYPAGPVEQLSCTNDPSTGNVWCFGGKNITTYSYVGFFDGTSWTASTPMPVPWYFNVGVQAGNCLLVESTTIYCCGNAGPPVGFCQLFDLGAKTWSNLTVTPRYLNGFAVVPYPSPRLVLWGGLDASANAIASIDVLQNGAVLSTTSLQVNSAQYPTTSTFGIGTTAVGFAGATIPNTNYVPVFVAIETAVGTIVDSPYIAATTPSWIASGNAQTLSGTCGGQYQNTVWFCGGDDSSNLQDGCWSFTLVCLGNSSSGNDLWINNAPTYVGCDLAQCHTGHYGPSCLQCNCNGQGCDDGFYGTGACTCTPGSFGADCSVTQTCSGNGLSTDGVTCVCFYGWSGADCSTALNCTTNGVFNPTDGTCACLPGFYGADCSSACNCGVGSTCSDGPKGTGECFCAPGTYSIAGAASNCSGTCNCGTGLCDDGNYGTGACQCASGFFGANCQSPCNCPPQVYSPTGIKLFRCDDGAQGTGSCIRIYNGASAVTSFLGLISVCLALFLF